jgi:phasin family protein
MNTTAAQFIETSKANVDALTALTSQAFAGVEKLVELNLATSKSALAESVNHVKAVLGAKDAQEVLALQSDVLKPLAEKSAAYAEQVKTIVTDSSAELTKAVETAQANFSAATTQTVDAVKKAAKKA